MRHRSWALPVLVSFLPFVCSCSSSYVPAASPRLSLVMDRGTYAYVRDGKKFEGGYFGGDIEEAVQGNAKAEEYARSYKTGLATGFGLTLFGAAAIIGGLVLAGAQVAQTPSGQDVPPTGFFIAGGGLIVELIGSLIAANAMPHLTDAINAYNDGLISSPPTSQPAQQTTGATAGLQQARSVSP